jgi:CelD/BcsL family acetyltransferase involved in cellulose biosynthesis
LRLVLHREIPEDQSLRDQWNSLVEQMERPEVFYTYEWALAVGRAYRPSVTPLLLLGYEGDSLAGLVALATDEYEKKAFFLAGTTADYCDFVCPSELRAKLVTAVFAKLRKLNLALVVLANLPSDSATPVALDLAAANHGYFVFSRPGHACAQIVFASSQQRELLKQTVQRKQMVRRNLKAMGKISPLALRHSKSWDDIAGILPTFVKAHVARFLAAGRISNLACPERRFFLSELAKLLSRRGWIIHTRLMVGDQPVAWNYGFQFAGSWFWYQPTFDCHFQQYSPGFCLLSKIVEEACDTPGMNFVDLGLGAEGYKERLATGRRQTLHITVAASRLVRAKESVGYHLAAAIKSAPRLEGVTRSALNRFSQLRSRFQNGGVLRWLRWSGTRCQKALFDQPEVLFFEWTKNKGLGSQCLGSAFVIKPLDMDLLAVAAMKYFDDKDTLAYLLRAAERLSSVEARGFALVAADGAPAHFCWVTDFEAFHMSELDHVLKAPSPDSVLLFDCWTPRSLRGRGYYTMSVSGVAAHFRVLGKAPWIFSSAANISSVRGLEKSAFTPRFSLTRKRRIFMSKLVQSKSLISASTQVNASSAA